MQFELNEVEALTLLLGRLQPPCYLKPMPAAKGPMLVQSVLERHFLALRMLLYLALDVPASVGCSQERSPGGVNGAAEYPEPVS